MVEKCNNARHHVLHKVSYISTSEVVRYFVGHPSFVKVVLRARVQAAVRHGPQMLSADVY